MSEVRQGGTGWDARTRARGPIQSVWDPLTRGHTPPPQEMSSVRDDEKSL